MYGFLGIHGRCYVCNQRISTAKLRLSRTQHGTWTQEESPGEYLRRRTSRRVSAIENIRETVSRQYPGGPRKNLQESVCDGRTSRRVSATGEHSREQYLGKSRKRLQESVWNETLNQVNRNVPNGTCQSVYIA